MSIRAKIPWSIAVYWLLVAPVLVLLASCENTEEAVPPSRIVKISGDGQYSKIGTTLPEPLVVEVQQSDLSPAQGVTVRFRTVEGGGALSSETRVTNDRGQAAAHYTLGAAAGPNRIRAELVENNGKFVEFEVTASDYFCPEEDPTFVRKFPSTGVIERDLFLFTRESNLNRSGGSTIPGIVRIIVQSSENRIDPRPVTGFEEDLGRIVVRDCAFSHNGDFYVAWMDFFPEVMKVMPNLTAHHFSSLESYLGAELTTGVSGVLAGCDEFGPFVVGCRDTLLRFEEALYSGIAPDQANTDAVAVDTNPQNAHYEDIYFIDLSDNTLRRLPLDSLTATGPTQVVVDLTRDEAEGARGMVCNNDGKLFVLVDDDDDTKVILSVTPAGEKTVEYDFFDRGPGDAAGVLSDLAIRKGGNPILYTIDTLGDMLLRYDANMQVMSEFYPDTLSGQDPESISKADVYGERVGLVVLP